MDQEVQYVNNRGWHIVGSSLFFDFESHAEDHLEWLKEQRAYRHLEEKLIVIDEEPRGL